jgi:hypothetical protein
MNSPRLIIFKPIILIDTIYSHKAWREGILFDVYQADTTGDIGRISGRKPTGLRAVNAKIRR